MEFFGGLAAFRESQHTLPSFVSFWADLDCFSPIKENGMNTIYPATKKARETSYPVWLLSSETTFLFIAKKNGFSVAGLGLSEKSGSRFTTMKRGLGRNRPIQELHSMHIERESVVVQEREDEKRKGIASCRWIL